MSAPVFLHPWRQLVVLSPPLVTQNLDHKFVKLPNRTFLDVELLLWQIASKRNITSRFHQRIEINVISSTSRDYMPHIILNSVKLTMLLFSRSHNLLCGMTRPFFILITRLAISPFSGFRSFFVKYCSLAFKYVDLKQEIHIIIQSKHFCLLEFFLRT